MIIDAPVKEQFPDLNILTTSIQNVTVTSHNDQLETFKSKCISDIRSQYTLDTLKNILEFRMYRDFFWSISIDPTKIRPASEALTRRILHGKPLPRINTVVDTYNIASIKTRIALAAFDAHKITPELTLRFAQQGEQFLGIGMDTPIYLQGNELVIQSGTDIIALYPYRDADKSKIMTSTTDIYLVVCGVPGISAEKLENAKKVAVEYIQRFC
jgi:DNA/RNA-binding domain of Phe-tRNA-synthetase-like protein